MGGVPLGPEQNATRALVLLMSAWLLDYKAAIGDHVAPLIQASGVALTLVALAHYLSSPGKLGPRALHSVRIALAFIGYALVVGLFLEQPVGAAIKAALPPLLFSAGLAIAYTALQLAPPERVRSAIVALAFGSALLKPLTWYFGTTEPELSEVRYQILSGSLLLLIGYCVVAFAARFRWKDAVILVTIAALIAASVTRSYLVVVVVMVAAQFAMSPRTFARMRSFGALAGIALVVAILALVGNDSVTEVVDRWEARIAYSDELGFDLTAASRIAEAEFQISSLRSSPVNAIRGNGIAARTELAGDYGDLFYAVAPNHEVSSIGFGHTDQTSIVFVGGVLVGGLFLLLTFRLMIWAFMLLRRALPELDAQRGPAFIACWGATTLIGVTVYGIFGGTFADRSASLHYGIAAAMVLWAMDSHAALPSRARA